MHKLEGVLERKTAGGDQSRIFAETMAGSCVELYIGQAPANVTDKKDRRLSVLRQCQPLCRPLQADFGEPVTED